MGRRKRYSFIHYIFIRYAVIIFLFAGLSYFLFNHYVKRFFYQNTINELNSFFSYFEKKEFFQRVLKPSFNRKVARQTGDAIKELSARLTIIKTNGRVLYDNYYNYKDMNNHAGRPEIKQALKEGSGSSLRHSSTLGKRSIYTAIRFQEKTENRENMTVIFRISRPLDEMERTLTEFQTQLILITLFLFFVSFFMAYAVSKQLGSFISRLVEAARQIAKGHFVVNLEDFYISELQKLSDYFSEMASQIHILFKKHRDDKEILENIIHSIDDGILGFDKDGRLVYMNNAFFEKLKPRKLSPEQIGKNTKRNLYFWELFDDIQFIDFIENSLKKHTRFSDEKKVKSFSFFIKVIFLPETRYTFFFFTDITEKQELEQTKKDFVANVSHELRTPLTTISGFTNAILKEKDRPVPIQYINIINRNVNRMFNLIKDIIFLAKAESLHEDIIKEKVNLKSFISDLAVPFEYRFKKEQIDFSVEVEDSMPDLTMDPYQMEQVFTNLIENSLRYGQPKHVKISASYEGDRFKIIFEDDGRGVPEKHLPHLFDRFFVVDKSRSRQSGGTGLGLSIVKHIIRNHKGTISAENIKDHSETTSGLRFIIIFPGGNQL